MWIGVSWVCQRDVVDVIAPDNMSGSEEPDSVRVGTFPGRSARRVLCCTADVIVLNQIICPFHQYACDASVKDSIPDHDIVTSERSVPVRAAVQPYSFSKNKIVYIVVSNLIKTSLNSDTISVAVGRIRICDFETFHANIIRQDRESLHDDCTVCLESN